jgi:hypothetical protein
MKSSSPCSCHATALDPCETGALELPRYYARQLLTPLDMTLEQKYFRDRMRRHNRLLHGWGVACGALVCLVPEEKGKDGAAPKPQPFKVRVTPGYVLGPYGDEILIDCERVVDLRTLGVEGESGEHGEPADPWCAEVFVKRDPGPLWLAVRYKELLSRPVRVEPAGCGCEDAQCEYSRLRDGYEIGVLTCCPPSHESPPSFDDLFRGAPMPGCPDCPADPWVVLARVEMDPDGTIRVIDNCSCRRIVVSWSALWWRCQGDSCALESVEVKDGETVQDTRFTLVVKTRLLAVENPQLRLGEGVDFVPPARVSPDRLEADFFVRPDAAPGPRTLEILDDQGNVVAAKANAVTVRPRQGGASPPPPAPAEPGGGAKPKGRGKGGTP